MESPLSNLNIVSEPNHYRFTDVCARLVPGDQCVTKLYDVSESSEYPGYYYVHLNIQGADDYLDCGGQIVEVENAIFIPIKRSMFLPGEQIDLENVKRKLHTMIELGVDIKAFRANQWRIYSQSGALAPMYSCSDNQESLKVNFATSKPCGYSVHKNVGDIMVDTYRSPQQAKETLKSYLSRL